jgi:parvulin-like peptidyl-prolyl isomerase
MRSYLQIVVLAVLVFAVQGICADPNAPKKAADANSVEPNTPALDSIAVTVNGKNIMESQVEKKIAPRLKSMSAQVPPQYMDQFKQQLRTRAVDGLIIESLLDEQVKAKGVTVSDEEVNNEIAKQLKEQNVTEEDLKKILTNYGISFEQYKKQIKQGLGYQKLIESQMGSVDVNDAAVEAYYKEHADEFKTPEQVRASHILISTRSTDPNADPNKVKAEAKAKAQDILDQIKKGGDFAELAKKNSADPGSAAKGGDLGFFSKGQMVKEFEETAFSLKPGEVSGLVETTYGYHIIKATDHKDANTTPMEQAKPQIKEMLTNQQKQQFAEKFVSKLKADAKITYPPGKEPKAPEAPKPIEIKPQSDANSKK